MGVLFCFLVPDEVEDEDKGKESEGGAAGMRMRDKDKLSLGCEVSKDGLCERDIERKEQFC